MILELSQMNLQRGQDLFFGTNDIKVYLYESLRPTPMLSFCS